MKTLNDSQREAVESNHPNMLVAASPGSGKTATLCARIERLVREGADPRRMAVCTFTNAAADEMTRRLTPIVPGYIGTIHGLALRILTRHGEQIGFPPRITVLDEGQAAALLESVKTEMGYKGTEKELRLAVAECLKWQRGTMPTNAQLTAKAFHNRLIRHGVCTFDTLLIHAARVARYCLDYDHLAIDESQDCSEADWAIFVDIPLAKKFFIGDQDQSIYGFRGACDRFAHLCSQWEWTGWLLIKLEQNYRSDGLICAAAQRLIEHNTGRVKKLTVPVSDQPGKVSLVQFPDDETERRFVCCGLRIWMDAGEGCALLCRTNAQVERWSEILRDHSIPVAVKRPPEFPPDWRKAKALLAYLGDPLNDFLCHQFASVDKSPAEADKLRTVAAADRKSMDAMSYCLAGEFTDSFWDSAAEVLGEHLTSPSCERIEKARAGLPENHTPAELLLAIQQADNQPVEVGEGVHVLTCHGAKGREFDHVFLPGFVDSIMPGNKKGADIEEERRLAFVAVTRARHSINVSWPLRMANPWTGAPMETRPSRFVAEMRGGS